MRRRCAPLDSAARSSPHQSPFACAGYTYERADVEEWLASHNTSPLTGLPLSTHELVPNEQLARHIQAAAAQ